MEYVVNLLSRTQCSHVNVNYYGYYQGKCYMVHGEYYPCHSGNFIDQKVKRYSSLSRALRGAESVVEKCGHVRGYEIYEVQDGVNNLVYCYPNEPSSSTKLDSSRKQYDDTMSDVVVKDTVKQQAPRTFHHLTGVCIEEALYNSDGEQIEGTSIPKVILFNTDVITLEEVEELLQSGEVEFSDKVMIIPRCVAENLADI